MSLAEVGELMSYGELRSGASGRGRRFPHMALFAISPCCNGASAAAGRPSVARLALSRQPVTPRGPHGPGAKAMRIVRRLNSTTTQPTRSIRTLSGMCLVAIAANGAAITPPMMRPAMIGHRLRPTVRKKVVDMVSVTKNSAMLTEPMAWRGFVPWPRSVDVTIGPHPPPPIASSMPPNNPNGATARGAGASMGRVASAFQTMKGGRR